jgi:hypothetical protein
MSIPVRRDDEVDDPLLSYALREVPQPPLAVSDLHTDAPPTAPDAADGRIDQPPVRVRHFEASAAIQNMRGRWLLDPNPVPRRVARLGRKSVIEAICRMLFVSVLLAIVVFLGITLVTSFDEARKQAGGIAGTITPTPGVSAHFPTTANPARLVVASQKGFANEPLPIGVSLKDASGKETVMLAGLAAGSRLSGGTPLGLAGWLISATDLDQALAYPPEDFVGVIDASINLRSANDQLIDSQVVRLEWIRKKEPPVPQPAASNPPTTFPLDPQEVGTLLKRGEDFLAHGDIASARPLLKRAASGGNAQAALEVAMSFDPAFLAQKGVLGLTPDVAQAREWYERASKLGSTEARRHLERLIPR